MAIRSDWLSDPSLLAQPRAVRVGLDDGSFVLRSPEPLQPYARCIGEWLDHWAAQTPDAPAFAERTREGPWRRLTWGETRVLVGRVAQSLLGLKLPPHAPMKSAATAIKVTRFMPGLPSYTSPCKLPLERDAPSPCRPLAARRSRGNSARLSRCNMRTNSHRS